MQKSFFKLFVFLLIFSSCANLEDKVLYSFEGKSSHNLSPIDSILLDKYGIFMPEEVIKHRGRYVIKKYGNENYIDIIDDTSNDVIHLANRGRAEHEFVNIGNVFYEQGKLYVYDVSQMKVVEYNLDSILAGNQQYTCNKFTFSASIEGFPKKPFVLNKHFDDYIAIGLWDDGIWYRLMSSNGELGNGVEQVSFECMEQMSQMQKSSLHLASCVSFSPSHGKIVCALNKAAALSVSSIRGSVIEELKRLVYYEPQVQHVDEEGYPILLYHAGNKVTFCDLSSDEDYIYILYSGECQNSTIPAYECSIVLVYDWNLNPIRYFELSKSINSFFMEGKFFYGTSTHPDSRIYKYEIPNI